MSWRSIIPVVVLLACADSSTLMQRSAVAPVHPAAPRVPLDPAIKRKTLDDLARIIAEAYVFPDAAAKLAARLRELTAHEGIWLADDAEAFATRVTNAMRTTVVDSHLELIVRPKAVTKPEAIRETAPESEAQLRERLRRRNFDIMGARYLRGTVGYVEIRSLPPAAWVGDTMHAALTFLGNADALIIDLRQNGGGAAATVAKLAGYFFDKPTHLLTSKHRRRGETTVYSEVPAGGARFANVDVYLLTSRQTFSAAEAFAYSLQGHRRAVVVGEPTGGGANAGDMYRLNDVFDAFVPDASSIHPATGRNWEAVGVAPDLASSADRALAVAHVEALHRLAKRSTDPQRRRELEWAALAVQNRRSIPRAQLERFAGHYGTRRVWLADGMLRYQNGTGPVQVLEPISDHAFMLANSDAVQLIFEPSALVLRWSGGDEERHTRSVVVPVNFGIVFPALQVSTAFLGTGSARREHEPLFREDLPGRQAPGRSAFGVQQFRPLRPGRIRGPPQAHDLRTSSYPPR